MKRDTETEHDLLWGGLFWLLVIMSLIIIQQ